MTQPYLLVYDHGTTGIRACLMDREGRFVAKAYSQFTQHYPQPGWVEHDANELWQVTLSVTEEVLKTGKTGWDKIHAIGLTNQRETVILWDRETGEPVYHAIVWQCRRTADFCDELKARGLAETIRQKTGLVTDPYFSASKIRWLLKNVPEASKLAEQNRLCFGTVDTWILWKLTGGKSHATDTSNASRTLLYNIHKKAWDPELLSMFEVPAAILPEVKASKADFGKTDPALTGGVAIPVTGIVGDQQAALHGQRCWQPGTAKSTYGTGAFLVMNLGEEAVTSIHGLLTTLACNEVGDPAYAMEGAIFIAGATLEWLQKSLGMITSAQEADELARSLTDNDGVYLVPAFVGLAAPYWDSNARGMITGLTQGAGRAQVARAALEAMAYQTREVLDLMQQEASLQLAELRVDGGVTRSVFLMQFLADILNLPVVRADDAESTALGAGYIAGLASGFWQSPADILALPETLERFEPRMAENDRKRLYAGWLDAVGKAVGKPKQPVAAG